MCTITQALKTCYTSTLVCIASMARSGNRRRNEVYLNVLMQTAHDVFSGTFTFLREAHRNWCPIQTDPDIRGGLSGQLPDLHQRQMTTIGNGWSIYPQSLTSLVMNV